MENSPLCDESFKKPCKVNENKFFIVETGKLSMYVKENLKFSAEF